MREAGEQKVYEFGNFRLDAKHLLLFRDGAQMRLTPKVVETLLVLISREGDVVTKDELMRELWPDTVVEESNLSQNLYMLRKALGTDADGNPYVETLRRRGYRFCGNVKFTSTPALNSTTSPRPFKVDRVDNIYSVAEWNADRPVVPASHRLRWPIAAIALLLGIALSVAAFTLYRGSAYAEKANAVFSIRSIERLTTSGRTKLGALSPDGRYLVFLSEDANGSNLWLRQVSSSSDVRVAGPVSSEIVWVDFAPGGDSIYYLSLDRDKGDTELFRVPTLGGPPVFAVYDTGPVGFSPDGGSIAFVRIYGNETRLIVANADGTNERSIAAKTEPERFKMIWNAPSWSPDGKTIACPSRLGDSAGQYETVVAVDAVTGSEKLLTTNRWSDVGQAKWTQDGVFVTASETAPSSQQIWQISADDGKTLRITQDLNDYSALTVTQDGSRIAAIQQQTLSEIAVGTANDQQKQIAAEVGKIDDVGWLPGGRIAYISGTTGEIWTVGTDGSNARQLTSGARAFAGLTVSPDGGRIVFSSTRSGKPNIWGINSDSSDLTQITFGDDETYPQFSPDGTVIVFQRGEFDPAIWRVAPGGGEPRRLTEKAGSRPDVSSDGKLVAYRYLDSSFERSRWSIGVVSIDGGPQLMRFDFPPTSLERYVRFAPDGRSVAFPNTVNGASEIWLQPLTGGNPKRLTDLNSSNIQAFDWSRDGKNVATIRTTVTRDVVLMKR